MIEGCAMFFSASTVSDWEDLGVRLYCDLGVRLYCDLG